MNTLARIESDCTFSALFVHFLITLKRATKLFQIVSYTNFIHCHGIYRDKTINATHDGKVGCNTVENTTAFLYSDGVFSMA